MSPNGCLLAVSDPVALRDAFASDVDKDAIFCKSGEILCEVHDDFEPSAWVRRNEAASEVAVETFMTFRVWILELIRDAVAATNDDLKTMVRHIRVLKSGSDV